MDNILGPTVDGSSPNIPVTEDFVFFRQARRALYVSNCLYHFISSALPPHNSEAL